MTIPDTVKNIGDMNYCELMKGKAGSIVEEYVKNYTGLGITFEAIE